mmetsp:Transcript_2941/g.5233  ORF Transcript_2941/g.5233 Transcript_2941/m.5233 type:complete len:81 (+) Transcript_2941:408-650(+)
MLASLHGSVASCVGGGVAAGDADAEHVDAHADAVCVTCVCELARERVGASSFACGCGSYDSAVAEPSCVWRVCALVRVCV